MKKKIAITAAAAAVVVLFAIRGTMAWLTDDQKVDTVIKTGNVNIEIEEKTKEPEGTFEMTKDGIVYKGNFMPGQTFSKIVTVRNIGVNRAYVRVKVTYQDHEKKKLIYDADRSPIVESSGFGSQGDSWELASDGYYYYNQALEPGAESAPVMETVKLPLSWDIEQTSAFHLVAIQAEAIQADYTGSTAKEAFGYQPAGRGIIADARSLTEEFKQLVEQYENASGSEKDKLLNQLRELMGAGSGTSLGNLKNNDTFRSALTSNSRNWPTVAEEGLADELHMSEEESQKWYVNIYVVIKDDYRVVPYISKAPNRGGGDQWKARYMQIDGVWYQPAGAPSAEADTTGGISSLYSVGWDGIKGQWKVVDFQ